MEDEGEYHSDQCILKHNQPASAPDSDGELQNQASIQTKLNQEAIESSIKIVFFSIFLDFMGISVVAPILPHFGEEFGANSFQIGALITSYCASSSIATLIMGKTSDHFGRRPMILFSLFGTMIGFLLTGFAQNYAQLLIYRFISGLFGVSRPIACAFVTDVIADKDERNKYLALTGASVGFAFVIGPGIGAGMAALFGLRAAFFMSSFLGSIGFIIAYCKLIESHPKYTKLQLPKAQAADLNVDIAENVNEDKSVPKVIWMLAFVFMLEQFGWLAYVSMWLLYTMHMFDFKVYEGGIMFVVNSAFYVLTAALFYPKISKKIGQYNTCLLGYISFSMMMLIAVLTDDLWISLIAMFICVGYGESTVTCVMTGIASNHTNESNRGYVMGIITGASSVMRVIGPLIAGLLFEYDPRLPFFAGAGSSFVGFLCVLCLYRALN